MDRKSIKKNMNIISAFAEDKVIQIINEKGEWIDLTERDGLPIETIAEDPNSFRIKPEPKYRPFANAKECWLEMQKHQPVGWIRNKFNTSGIIATIIFLDSRKGFKIYIDFNHGNSSEDMINSFVFADGTPFGVKVSE